MHKLLEYINDEMETLEHKAGKDGKLTMQEIQYMDTLAHAKKNILTAEAMEDYDDDYSKDYGMEYSRADRRGRGSRAKRDSMGRYSSRYSRNYSYAKEDLKQDLHDMEREADDEETRHMIKRWIKQLEE